MKYKKIRKPSISPDISARFSWAKLFLSTLLGVFVFAGCLISAATAQAQQINALYLPLTNAPATPTTNFPSSTQFGGVSVNLGAFSGAGALKDLEGTPGSGVNGLSTGVSAMCLTNGQTGDATHSANGNAAANSGADLGDPALAFGTVSNFLITFWFKEPVVYSDAAGNLLPRLFVLSTGGSPGAGEDTVNSIGVKFQVGNQFELVINNAATTTGNSYNLPANTATLGTTLGSNLLPNKWYFVAWVYDGTNLYQFTGSDTAVATLQNQFSAPGLAVTLGNPSTLILGNKTWKGSRGFFGSMEDFRIYTNVASAGNNANFVENIRKAIAPKIPTITGIYPDGTSLLQATNTLVFTAQAPSGFNLTSIDLKLNNVDVTSGCTFVTNGTGSTNVTVTYVGLTPQVINTAVMTATDADGLVGSSTVTFDTFSPANFIVKAEEFDFSGGQFIDNPVYTNVTESDSYFGLDSMEGVDTHKGGAAGAGNDVNCYRATDGLGTRTQTPLAAGELPSPTRFGGNVVPSHMVGNWSSGEWQNYTKTFPAGNYNVYARLSTSSGSTIILDQVVAGQTTTAQTLSRLGQFTYSGSGAFQWVPLLQNGSLAVVNLSGQNTVRATTGGGANADFYMLVPANPNLPVIGSVYPDGNYLFEATNKLTFTVSSAAGINTANITLTLNGTNVSSGLVFTGGPDTWNASYTGLQFNQTYASVISVTDSNSFSANATLSIDTWNPVMQVEAEDFDFDPTQSPIFDGTGSRFIDNPVPTPPGVAAANSYEGQVAVTNIDDGGGASATGHADYRPKDTVATTPVTDLARRQFVNGALDYNVGFLGPGMWQQYTKTWPAGTYNLYARVASGANLGTIYSSFSQVVAGWGTANQLTRHVGTYALPTTNGYSSYLYAPLMDQFGNYANLTLGGTNTFRDTHLVFNQTETANGAVFGLNINFYMLVAPRTDLPRIDGVYPNGTVLMQQTNTFSFVASNPTYGIATNSVQVILNGVDISSNLVFSGSSSSWNVSYPGLQQNTSYTVTINITDNNNQMHTTTVNFDTFSANNFTWEAEDFDFDPANSPVPNGSGLQYIDNPAPTSAPATNSYYGQAGDLDIDYSSIFLNVLPVPTVYRSAAQNLNNIIPIEVTADSMRQKYQNAQLLQVDPGIQDYDIFNLTNGAWINYTHTFPTGNFYVYARVSAGGTNPISFQCAQVTSGAGTTPQTTNVLGYFQAIGNNYATWQYAPLINTNTDVPVVLSLGGVETLQVDGDGFEHVNFYMLVPVPPNSVSISVSISGPNIQLSFPTQTGYTYAMEYKNNLSDPTWTPVVGGGNPVTGNGSTQSVMDSLGQNHRFYRLVIQ
jgi:hypothetical protein